MTNSCKNCMHYQFQLKMKDGSKGGVCKRFPPHPVMLQQVAPPQGGLQMPQQQPQIMHTLQGFFPPVSENEFCGEWEWTENDDDDLNDGTDNDT